MPEPGEDLALGDDAADVGNDQGTERDHVVPQPRPEEQSEERNQQGEEEDLISGHLGVRCRNSLPNQLAVISALSTTLIESRLRRSMAAKQTTTIPDAPAARRFPVEREATRVGETDEAAHLRRGVAHAETTAPGGIWERTAREALLEVDVVTEVGEPRMAVPPLGGRGAGGWEAHEGERPRRLQAGITAVPNGHRPGLEVGGRLIGRFVFEAVVAASGRQRWGAHREVHAGEDRRVVSGGWIAARIRIGPRRRGHSSTSIAKTRFISSAHASRLARAPSGRGGVSAWVFGRVGGVAGNARSGIDPSLSIEAESGVAASAALAGSSSTRAGVEADSRFEAGCAPNARGPAGTMRSRSLAQGPRTPW